MLFSIRPLSLSSTLLPSCFLLCVSSLCANNLCISSLLSQLLWVLYRQTAWAAIILNLVPLTEPPPHHILGRRVLITLTAKKPATPIPSSPSHPLFRSRSLFFSLYFSFFSIPLPSLLCLFLSLCLELSHLLHAYTNDSIPAFASSRLPVSLCTPNLLKWSLKYLFHYLAQFHYVSKIQ